MDFPSKVKMETLMIHGVWGSTYPLFISFTVFANDVSLDIKAFLTKPIKSLRLGSYEFMFAFSNLCFFPVVSEIDVIKYSSNTSFCQTEKIQGIFWDRTHIFISYSSVSYMFHNAIKFCSNFHIQRCIIFII
jgi:hypothetical protein